jgi:imidazolonepropionase-like amidohydrolase
MSGPNLHRRAMLAGLSALGAAPALAQASVPAEAADQAVALVGGRVVTNAGPVLPEGVVTMHRGRVVSVGTSVPAGVRAVDVAGHWVTPGIFVGHCRVGLAETDMDDATNDSRVASSMVAAVADATFAFDPQAASVAVSRLDGVTRMAVAPIGGPSPISGYGAIADTSGLRSGITRPRAFISIEAGDRGAARAGRSRMTLWPWIEAAIDDARAFPTRYMSHSEGSVLRRPEAQAFAAAVRGEVPILLGVERESDLRQAMALRQRHPALQLVLVGAAEGWRVADALAAAGLPVIVDPWINLPNRFEQRTARLDNAALLQRAGVRTVIAPLESLDDGFLAGLTPQLAGNAVANGMAWDAAFAAITSVPAAVHGLPDHGVLRAGAPADIVVWNGDPLEVTSNARAVYIDGRALPMESRQTHLRRRYQDLRDARTRPFGYRN